MSVLRIERASLNEMTLNEYLLNCSKYVFVSKYISEDSAVLDIACGEGYGLQYLNNPKCILAADISLDALKKVKIYSPQAHTIMWDAQDFPFQDNAFDAITSFETIEHLKYPEKFLLELKRVAKPDAYLILSTPNRLYKMPWVRNINPYHLREYTIDELESLLSQFFDDINIFAQIPKFEARLKDNIVWTLRKIITLLPTPLAIRLLKIARNSKKALSRSVREDLLVMNHQYQIVRIGHKSSLFEVPQTIVAVVKVKKK